MILFPSSFFVSFFFRQFVCFIVDTFFQFNFMNLLKFFAFREQGVAVVSSILAKSFIPVHFYSFRLLPDRFFFRCHSMAVVSVWFCSTFYFNVHPHRNSKQLVCYHSRVNIIARCISPNQMQSRRKCKLFFLHKQHTKQHRNKDRNNNSKEILCGNMMIYLYDTLLTFYATHSSLFSLSFQWKKITKINETVTEFFAEENLCDCIWSEWSIVQLRMKWWMKRKDDVEMGAASGTMRK